MVFMILITEHSSSLSPIESGIPDTSMSLRLQYCPSKWLNSFSRTSTLLLNFAFSSCKFLIITSLTLIASSLRFENPSNNLVSKFAISTDVCFPRRLILLLLFFDYRIIVVGHGGDQLRKWLIGKLKHTGN